MIDNGYNFSSLRNVRSALSKPIKYLFKNYDFLTDPKIDSLLSYAKVNCKKTTCFFPVWSIDKVMNLFQSSEFKNKCLSDVHLSLIKDFFLILMACPKRISEFKALTIQEIIFHSDDSVTLVPHNKFIKKNHTDKFKPKDISFPSLRANLDLCPVRALKHYIHFTNRLCIIKGISRPHQLWINKNLKPASLNCMRNWVRSIIFNS